MDAEITEASPLLVVITLAQTHHNSFTCNSDQ